MERSDRGAAALERIKSIRGTSGTGRGTQFTQVEQTIIDPGSFVIMTPIPRERKPAVATSPDPILSAPTPYDSDAPPLEDDQDEHRVARRLLVQQVEGVGEIQNTDTTAYVGLRRDPVIVLQDLLPEDPIMELAEKRAKEKGLIILL